MGRDGLRADCSRLQAEPSLGQRKAQRMALLKDSVIGLGCQQPGSARQPWALSLCPRQVSWDKAIERLTQLSPAGVQTALKNTSSDVRGTWV